MFTLAVVQVLKLFNDLATFIPPMMLEGNLADYFTNIFTLCDLYVCRNSRHYEISGEFILPYTIFVRNLNLDLKLVCNFVIVGHAYPYAYYVCRWSKFID